MYHLATDNNYCCPSELFFSLTNLPSIPGNWFLHLRFPSLLMYTDVFMLCTSVNNAYGEQSPYLVSHSIACSLTYVLRQVSYGAGSLQIELRLAGQLPKRSCPHLPSTRVIDPVFCLFVFKSFI